MEIKLYNLINDIIDKKYKNKFTLDIRDNTFYIYYNNVKLEIFTELEKQALLEQVRKEEEIVDYTAGDMNTDNFIPAIPIAIISTGVVGTTLSTDLPYMKKEDAEQFLELLKRNTPKKTGKMRRGWRIKTLREDKLVVDNRVKYTGYVNDGTKRIRARQFIEKTLRQYRNKGKRERKLVENIDVTYR